MAAAVNRRSVALSPEPIFRTLPSRFGLVASYAARQIARSDGDNVLAAIC